MTVRIPRVLLFLLGLLLVAGLAAGAYFLFVQEDEEDDSETTSLEMPSVVMLPAIEVGQSIDVDPKAYRTDSPAVGDIVVFHPPKGAQTGQCGVPRPPEKSCPRPTAQPVIGELFVMRVIAGPLDRVSVRDGKAIVNGQADDTEIVPCAGGSACNLPVPIVISPGMYFLLGDNRGASDDSRFWGPVPGDWIVGKVTNAE